MKMNTISRYTLVTLFFVVGVVSSCKDYLELQPVSSFSPDYVFGSVSSATKAVLGAYSALSGDDGYGKTLSMYFPYDDDQITCNGVGGDADRKDLAHYNFDAANKQIKLGFERLYAGIEKANLCLHYIPLMNAYNNGSDADKKALRRLHGEVLTLRAQYYFELIRNWGDVPAQYLAAVFDPNLFKAKSERNEIYDQILADLVTAADLVPWRSEVAKDDRITQGAVHALRARIALFRGGYSLRVPAEGGLASMKRSDDYLTFYQMARDECNIVIQKGEHKLNPSFQAVFKDALDAHVIEPNGEVIWEAGMVNGNATSDSKLGYYNGPKDYARGTQALIVLPTFFYLYDKNDLRRDVSCVPYMVNVDKVTITANKLELMADGKFRRSWVKDPDAPPESQSNYLAINWPMIRYSDVLLMFAEAENELNGGPTPAAIAAFEQVRSRGFGPNTSKMGTTPTDKTGFFTAIINERAFEFCAEGIRKYDLIRWNKLGEKIFDTQSNLALLSAKKPPYDTYPTTMYYQTATAPIVWVNDLYSPTPGVAPTGTGISSVSWVGSTVGSSLTYYASGFTANHSELLPFANDDLLSNRYLIQNDGY